MHVKSVADALLNEGHLPCSDGFTATGSGSPWEQIPCSTGTLTLSCWMQDYSYFLLLWPCPWASGYAVTQLQQQERCLLSKHPAYIMAKMAVGHLSKVKFIFQDKSPWNPSFLLFWGEFQCFLMLEMPLRWVPLNSLKLLPGEQGWMSISSIARRNTSHWAFVIKHRANRNLDQLHNIL